MSKLKAQSASTSARIAYQCDLAILREDDGTYSVLVLNLPGAGSCGDTRDEAIANVREAVVGVIESHLADKEDIPWLNVEAYTAPQGAERLWISVDA